MAKAKKPETKKVAAKKDGTLRKRNLPKQNPTDASTYSDVISRFYSSQEYQRKLHNNWDENEQLFAGERADQRKDKGVVSDGTLSTQTIDRAARVMSQIQTGRVREVGTTKTAAATVADLLYRYDIVPNANSGGPFLIKMRQVDMYRDIYGMVPALYGLNVTEDEIFADWWPINPRKYFPQPGKLWPHDMQWNQVETTITVGQLKAILKYEKTSWNQDAVRELIKRLKEGSSVATAKTDNQRTTHGERTKYNPENIAGKGDYAPVTIRTEYQAGSSGQWITYVADHDDIILRNSENRHKNDRIPTVHAASIPLLDELYGLGAFDRGKPIQKTIDAFLNLGYQNALLNVLPPLKVNTSATITSSLSLKPGAKWEMNDLKAVEPFSTGNLGQEYFERSVQSLRGILLDQAGTTDNRQTADTADNPAFGRTPKALARAERKENARDNWDIVMMDLFYSELAHGLLDVRINAVDRPPKLSIDTAEYRKLKDDESVQKLLAFDEETSTVTPKLSALRNKKFRYEVDSGTSVEADDATENERLTEILKTLGAAPDLIALAKDEGYQISIGALLKKYIASSGTKDYDEIIKKPEETDETASLPPAGQQLPTEPQSNQVPPQQPPQPQEPQEPVISPEIQDPAMQEFVAALQQDPQGVLAALQEMTGGQNGGSSTPAPAA